MRWIEVLLWFLPRRLRSSWVLLAITSFGILAAVTLMATGAIYSHTLAHAGLQHALASRSASVHNVQVAVRTRPLGEADYQALRRTVEEVSDQRLGYLLEATHRYGKAPRTMNLVMSQDAPLPPGPDVTVGQPFFLTDFQRHSRLVEGRWPRLNPDSSSEMLELETVVGVEAAAEMGFEVGSRVYLIPFRSDPSERISITVVGLAEPLDPLEEFWMDPFSYFNVVDLTIGGGALAPLYVTETQFLEGLGGRYPTMVGDYGWFFFLDTDLLTPSKVEMTREAMRGLETDIGSHFSRSLVISRLDRTMAEYKSDLTLARVSLFLFISLVVVVIMYFLALVMGLLAQRHSGEASLLTSRGASVLQVSGLLAVAEGVIVLVALALGPFLALAIVRYLLLDTLNPTGGRDVLTVGLSVDMFLMGAIGAAMSLVVLMASGVTHARLGVVDFLRARARPPSLPLLQRYYVDLLVLALAGLVLWQIKDREGVAEGELVSGVLEVDTSLLLGPALILIATSFLALRLMPMLISALALVARSVAPAWASIALTRIARDPLPPGSLMIMLMMATALGVFGATFQTTLSNSQRDRASYQLGGELVLKAAHFSESLRNDLAGIPGVQTVSSVGRDNVNLLDVFPNNSATALYLDPLTLPDTAWFRNDFADKGLSDLLSPLAEREHPPEPLVLPADAESVGLWAKVDNVSPGRINQRLTLWLRVSDSRGIYRNLDLGDPAHPEGTFDGGWTYFESPLPVGPTSTFQPPFSLASIFISGTVQSTSQPGSITIDDISVKGRSSSDSGAVVERFEAPGRWELLPNSGKVPDVQERTVEAARSGLYGLTFSWKEALGGMPRGILIPRGPSPLPAVGGAMFSVGQELRLESGSHILPVVIRDVTRYFPTIRPQSGPFLLLSNQDYSDYTTHAPGLVRVQLPQEDLWVSLEEDADRSETVPSIVERLPLFSSAQDRAALVDRVQRNPLAGGGWNGLTVLSVSALTVAVVLALCAHAAAALHNGRVDLTIIRVLGLSRFQLLMSISLERIVVAALGIGAGSAIGFWLGSWVLGFLDITSGGRELVPPMIVTAHKWLMALVYVELAAALALATGFAAVYSRRLRASDTLRTE